KARPIALLIPFLLVLQAIHTQEIAGDGSTTGVDLIFPAACIGDLFRMRKQLFAVTQALLLVTAFGDILSHAAEVSHASRIGSPRKCKMRIRPSGRMNRAS